MYWPGKKPYLKIQGDPWPSQRSALEILLWTIFRRWLLKTSQYEIWHSQKGGILTQIVNMDLGHDNVPKSGYVHGWDMTIVFQFF